MIFLDMDGPFADFHAGYRAISGGEDPPPYFGRSKAEEDKMWRKIHATPDFFANLPLVEGALDFYHWLRLEIVTDADHAFLTACPPSKYHNVAEQKKRWVRNTLAPHSPLVIPTWGSKAKSAHNPERSNQNFSVQKDFYLRRPRHGNHLLPAKRRRPDVARCGR